jgi:hypothetical protein
MAPLETREGWDMLPLLLENRPHIEKRINSALSRSHGIVRLAAATSETADTSFALRKLSD